MEQDISQENINSLKAENEQLIAKVKLLEERQQLAEHRFKWIEEGVNTAVFFRFKIT